MDRAFYAELGDNWDDNLFRDRILNRLASEMTVLDLGAGAGILKQMDFRARARRICGIDLDPRVTLNPYLDEAKIANGESIPFPDATFDLVFSNNVLEHLAEPEKVFAEIHRVLKSGGLFFFKTPNKWHYVPLIARFTPYGFHKFINRRRGRKAEDIFLTFYRANSIGSIHRLAKAADFMIDAIELIEGRPEYLRIHPVTYAVGIAYERLVNLLPFLAVLRVILVGTLRKPQ